jgi:hypothetical protein
MHNDYNEFAIDKTTTEKDVKTNLAPPLRNMQKRESCDAA